MDVNLPDLKIIKITNQDWPEVAQVLMLAFNTVDQGWTEESSLAWVETYKNYSANYLARIDNQIVGFITATKKSDQLLIDAIGVHPDHMRQGIAKLLWNKVMTYAADNQLKEALLIADPNSTAYQWYKNQGFTKTGWVEMTKKLD